MGSTINGIDATNAGLFSAAAYHPIGTLEVSLVGWYEPAGFGQTSSDNVDRVRVFVDDTLQEVVLAIKGMDNLHDLKSVAFNAGGAEYAEFYPLLVEAYLQASDAYPTYHFFVDGHSMGGGLAQNFALETGLDGFGQNSLPATTATPLSLSIYRAVNTFIETNVAGDPATIIFSKLLHDSYLDANPTELPSIYPALESAGIGVGTGTTGFDAALAGWALYYAHAIDTVNTLSAKYFVGADGHLDVPPHASLIPDDTALWFGEAIAKVRGIEDDGSGSLSIEDWKQEHFTVTSDILGTSDVQSVAMTVSADWLNYIGPVSVNVSAELINANPASPNYQVSWSWPDANWYDYSDGSFAYNSDGSFTGQEHIGYSAEALDFSYDPGLGTIVGPFWWPMNGYGTSSETHGTDPATLSADGSFKWSTIPNYKIDGIFAFAADGTATWSGHYEYFPDESASYTLSITSHVDGGFYRRYEFDTGSGNYYTRHADGSGEWGYIS